MQRTFTPMNICFMQGLRGGRDCSFNAGGSVLFQVSNELSIYSSQRSSQPLILDMVVIRLGFFKLYKKLQSSGPQ